MNQLKLINKRLAKVDLEFIQELDSPKHVTLIIAPPRGGSTLLQQVLISALDVGYISNLMAKFWEAPVIGATVHKDLFPKNFMSSFSSKYGNTEGVFEPHEWGWFWQKELELVNGFMEKAIDGILLNKKLAAMENILGSPFIIDSPYIVSNLNKFKEVVDNVFVINLERDPYFLCNSIINARLNRYNDVGKFYGHKPKGFSKLEEIADPIEQCVAQIYMTLNEIDNDLKLFNEKKIFNITYEDLRSKPELIVKQYIKFLNKSNIEVKVKEVQLPKFEQRNSVTLINSVYKDKLNYYFKEYFPNIEISY